MSTLRAWLCPKERYVPVHRAAPCAITRSARVARSSSLSPSSRRMSPDRPPGDSFAGSLGASGPRTRRSPIRPGRARFRPDHRSLPIRRWRRARSRGEVRTRSNRVIGEQLARASPCRRPIGVRGRSVRPVCRPAALQAGLPVANDEHIPHYSSPSSSPACQCRSGPTRKEAEDGPHDPRG